MKQRCRTDGATPASAPILWSTYMQRNLRRYSHLRHTIRGGHSARPIAALNPRLLAALLCRCDIEWVAASLELAEEREWAAAEVAAAAARPSVKQKSENSESHEPNGKLSKTSIKFDQTYVKIVVLGFGCLWKLFAVQNSSGVRWAPCIGRVPG